MSTKIVVGVLVCVFIAIAQSAPQFDQQYQQQPEQNSRFAVLDGSYHQDPNLEYNFELVFRPKKMDMHWSTISMKSFAGTDSNCLFGNGHFYIEFIRFE